MASKYNIDLTGRKFGNLVAIKGLDEYTVIQGYSMYQKWECLCDCGTKTISNSRSLLKGFCKNCGINCKKRQDLEYLIGKRYGMLSVLSLVENIRDKSGNRFWLCKCDCGKYRKVTTASLCSGSVTHCGCKKLFYEGKNYEDRSILAAKNVYRNYKESAKIKNKEFNLSFEEFLGLAKLNCFYCGTEPKNYRKSNYILKSASEFVYNGIDRIDNNKGYYLENCVPSCFMCNGAKRNRTVKEFIDWIVALNNNLKNKGIKNG